MKQSEQITRDLMQKASDDVNAVLRRVLSIAPEPKLPVAVSAAASAIGQVAGLLHLSSGGERGKALDPECLLLAGLLVARMGIDKSDPIGEAYRDFDALKEQGRTASGDGQ